MVSRFRFAACVALAWFAGFHAGCATGPFEDSELSQDGARGTLSKDQIQTVIRAHKHEVRACLESELDRSGSGGLSGKMVFAWTITASGGARGTHLVQSTLDRPGLEECVRTRIATWSFPEPAGGGVVDVTYPFFIKAAD